ncbi:MAG TPA: hypothetical protein VEM13_03000 [Gemmatimonadales bacterium]|nr:hypothetical protein [Gemmatimonadales bacterium]
MRVVRLLVVALTLLVVGFACDRLPTDMRRPPVPSAQTAPAELLSCWVPPDEAVMDGLGRNGKTIRFAPHCVQPTVRLQAQRSNYAVAW